MDSRDERAGGSRQDAHAGRTIRAWLRSVCLGAIAALLAGSGGVAAPSASAQLQPPLLDAGRLFAPDGLPRERFGHAVALDGSTLAVGARNAKVGVDDGEGAVYVFRRAGSTWAREARITGPSSAAGDRFGRALDLSATTVAVGAPYEGQRGAPDSGVVHIFSGLTSSDGDVEWTETARLTASDADRGDHFGYSVALAGETLLAGAPHRDGRRNDDGGVYASSRARR